MKNTHSKMITTRDGITLHYFETNPKTASPYTVVIIPGGGQSAEEFYHQYEALGERIRIIGIDMRGHGKSSDPGTGYSVARFAKDLYDVLEIMDLQNVVLLGHSLGCSVIWCYWQLFGPKRLAKLVLVDEPPAILINPAWTLKQKQLAGATMTADDMFELINQLSGQYYKKTLSEFIDASTTDNLSMVQKNWLLSCMLRSSANCIASIFYDNMTRDWRTLIPTINLPTLVIGGKCSITPWESQVWIHQQIPNSQLEVFESDERGSHFMFIENFAKFNQILFDFIDHP